MKVARKTKNRGGKSLTYRCSSPGCTDEIKPGEDYFEWCFYRQRPTRIHASHGYPRNSMLTQSKMAEVYAGVEEIEDLLAEEDWDFDDVTNALENLVSTCDEVAQEYQDAAEPFGGQGEHAERAEAVESFSSNLGSLSLDEFDEEGDESREDWRERIKGEVEGAIGEAP